MPTNIACITALSLSLAAARRAGGLPSPPTGAGLVTASAPDASARYLTVTAPDGTPRFIYATRHSS